MMVTIVDDIAAGYLEFCEELRGGFKALCRMKNGPWS